MGISFTPEEKEILLLLLDNKLFELRTMIRHSNSYDCKATLKLQKEIVRNLRNKIEIEHHQEIFN